MRVISGSARGLRLQEPDGMETRPTTDRVKEGLFSAIQFRIPGAAVLDLFAGTGQLGIECLSRGAARAVFVELRPAAAAAVRENLRRTGLAVRAQVLQSDGLGYLEKCRERFDLVFLDPPYGKGLLEQAAGQIIGFDILAEHGIMVCEHPASAPLPELPAPCRWGRSYRYGKIAVTLCQREEGAV